MFYILKEQLCMNYDHFLVVESDDDLFDVVVDNWGAEYYKRIF